MKAVRLSFFQMIAVMRRDLMLFAACLAPIFAGLFFRFAIPFLEAAFIDCLQISAVLSPYYMLVDILFAMLPSTMFCFVSAMVALEERDEKTAAYLFITPLKKSGYIAARLGIPSGIAFFATIVLLPVFKLTALSPPTVLFLSTGGTLQGIIVALLVLTISSNKLEGMAVAKLSTLTILGLVIPFFLKSDLQYIMSLLPSFWIGKAILENMPLDMLFAFGLSAMWICFLLNRYLRKI